MGDLTRNFSRWEFACHCGCGFDDIEFGLVLNLQALRDLLQQRLHREYAIHVNSGCRCKKYNKAVGGVPGSQHTEGRAADIVAKQIRDGHEIPPDQLAPLAAQLDAFHHGGIGVYDTFLHVDVRGFTARWGEAWNRDLLRNTT